MISSLDRPLSFVLLVCPTVVMTELPSATGVVVGWLVVRSPSVTIFPVYDLVVVSDLEVVDTESELVVSGCVVVKDSMLVVTDLEVVDTESVLVVSECVVVKDSVLVVTSSVVVWPV